METRWLSKGTFPGPAFVAVTVKEELPDAVDESDEYRHSEAPTPRKEPKASSRKLSKTTSNTNTHDSPEVLSKPVVIIKKHRSTQVEPEDLDLAFIKESDRVEMLTKACPIELPIGEDKTPQCRICLRRVARENLDIIMGHHKKKARVAFQIRVIPHDAYPFICINCQSLLDMFFEFKNAIIKAKNLLKCKRVHMESSGWDDQESIELFKKCKQAILLHRQQIDSLYDEHTKPQKTEYEEEYLDDNDNNSGAEDGDISEPMIKPECVITETEVPAVSIDVTVPIEDTPREAVTAIVSNPKLEIDDSDADVEEADDSEVDEDYKIDEDYDPNQDDDLAPYQHTKRLSIKKEKKEKVKQIPTVKRQLCDLCGEYIRPESVEGHRNKHLGIKPYICSVEKCEVAFSSRYNLSKHMKKFHKPGGVGAHPCNICGKVIQGSIGVLKYHQKRHNIDTKSFICQVCGKGFTMKWYLTQHSIIHTGEFPHKCKYCGKRFNNKWSMKTHEKNIHEKKNQLLVQPQESPEVPAWNPTQMNSIPNPIPLPLPQIVPPVGAQQVYAMIPDENSGQSSGQ